MSVMPTVAMIVNKDEGRLSPSETFLRAHATQLPTRTVSLVGNPGLRRSGTDGGAFLNSRSAFPLGTRWLVRQIGLDSIAGQDTRALRRFFRREGVEVVLAEYGPTAVSVLDACLASTVPLVAHFHGWDAYVLPQDPIVLQRYRRLFEDAAAMIGVSRHMIDHLIDLGAPSERLHWNPCGAAVPQGERSSPGSMPPNFVSVGRFTPKKAPFITLTAFSKVVERIPDATLEMVGDGPLLDGCRQLARGLGIQSAVKFYGAGAHDLVFDVLARGRCFVQHSVTAPDGDREGTPVAVLEAMANGLPVVSTRHTGIMDVVHEGLHGTLVDEYDVDGMVDGMLEYALDPSRAAAVGRAARDAVIESWSMERSIGRLWAILEGTLE